MRKLFSLVPLALVFTIACGGTSSLPTGPSSPIQPPTTAVTKIAFLSELGGPAVGVTVTSGGNSAVTDGDGVATFNALISPGASLTLNGGPFLNHACIFSGSAVHNHALIPADDGQYSRPFLQELMFKGGTTLNRMDAPGSVILDPAMRGDPAIVAAQERAARVHTALHPTIPFRLRDDNGKLLEQALPGDVPIHIRLGTPNQEAGLASVTVSNGRIIEAFISLKNESYATGWDLAAHELGHAFGFGHNLEVGIMSPGAEGNNLQDFTAKEKAVAKFMLDRTPGTRCEDTTQ